MLYQTKNSHGGDIYAEELLLDYSANTNPFGTPRTVLDAAAASLDGLSAYPDPYCRGLVNALSAYEQVPRDRILCSGGASELIYAFCRALKPKTALVPVPSFSEYEKALGLCGCAPSHFLLKQENDFAVTEELLTVLLKEKPQVLFLCTPNNPTGVLLEPALLQKLLQLCLQTGTFVLLDECFLDMTAEGISAAAVADRFPNLVILKAFTKNFGMAGLRLVYCIS